MPDAPLRVLWLIKGLGPGGAEHLLVNQAAARDRDAFRYEAAYLVPAKAHLVPQLEALGVPVTALDAPREWDPRWAWRLRRRLRHEPVDVIHNHSPYVAAVTRLLVRTLPRRDRPALVYTEHNRWPRHRPTTRLANRLTFALDDVQLAVSEDVRASMPPRARRQVVVLRHGVDVASVRQARGQRAAARAELGIDDDTVVVGIVANYRREKAYDVLLRAARRVLDELADRRGAGEPVAAVRFVAVGQGPLEADMRALHEQLALGEDVLLLGYRDDAVRVMTAFDIFTMSSRHEGLPVALMDALVLGLPVVATRVGGIPEAVTDGVEGTLVAPDDPAALARALVALATDPARRSAAADAAATAGAGFDIADATRELERRYRDAAARRDRNRS